MRPSFTVNANGKITGVYSFCVEGNIAHDVYDPGLIGKVYKNGEILDENDPSLQEVEND